MSISLDAETIARKCLGESPSERAIDTQIGQTLERIDLVSRWGIKDGDRILEIGCGQGDMTAVLATAVGVNGRITAIDPAPLSYGEYQTLSRPSPFAHDRSA